jgi:hypothetical protein
MGMINMLERLVEFGAKEGFFDSKSLGELEKTCCPQSKTEVIDYDKTKEMVSNEAQLQQPKSADALKIMPQLNRLDFIELKRFEDFIHHNKDKNNFNETLGKQIEKFNLQKKIRDSLLILSTLINSKKFICTSLENSQYEQVIKNYIVVVDVDLSQDPIKDRLVTLVFLAMKRTIESIPTSPLENFKQSKLLNCKRVDQYYDELLSQAQVNVTKTHRT